MKKLITILFIVSTTILAVTYILELNNSKKLREQLNEKNLEIKDAVQELAVSKTETVKLMKTIVDYKEEIADLKSSKNELAIQVEQQTEKLENVAAETEKNKKETAGEKFASGLAKMMKSPEMQETMRMQIENTLINPVFGSLIKELGLDEMDTEIFRNLLSHRFMIGASSGMKMMKADKEQKDALKEQIKNEQKVVDSMIKEMLGDVDYKKYEGYMDSMEDRVVCNKINQQLLLSGENLTTEQNNRLVKVMGDERLKLKEEENFPEMKNSNPFDWTENQMEKYLQQKRKLNDNTVKNSGEILNENQQNALELFLENQLRLQETQLKMAQKMFGKEKKK